MSRKHPRSSPQSSPKAPETRSKAPKTRSKTLQAAESNATDAPRTKRVKSRLIILDSSDEENVQPGPSKPDAPPNAPTAPPSASPNAPGPSTSKSDPVKPKRGRPKGGKNAPKPRPNAKMPMNGDDLADLFAFAARIAAKKENKGVN